MTRAVEPAATEPRVGPVALSVAQSPEEAGGASSDGQGSRDRTGARARVAAWAELLRLPALFTVPGDVLAGAAASGGRVGPRALLAIGSSLCLYEAGMALNDWADREEDAAERPHRPLPSGRVRPAAALAAACGLTAGGLALAGLAGRPALAVAAPLAATVWAYDLTLKHTPAGPPAMAAARSLDLLLGAAATGGDVRAAVPSAALLGTHTLAVTAVSREETRGGSSLAPLAALATTALLARQALRRPTPLPAARGDAATPGLPGSQTAGRHTGPTPPRRSVRSAPRGALGPERGTAPVPGPPPASGIAPGRGPRSGWLGSSGAPGEGAGPLRRITASTGAGHVPVRSARSRPPGGSVPAGAPARGAAPTRPSASPGAAAGGVPAGLARAVTRLTADRATPLTAALAAVYAATAARPYFHAALNPSPPLTQRAVGGGIRATIPLQAALSARAGGVAGALVTAALAPLGRRFARKVSIT